MYKVVIIDDEPIIVKGLSKMVPWEKYGCEVAGTAEDGLTGLRMIREIRPDIVFSDIYMPKMNGLLMAAALKSEFEDMELTILTGYRDFELVQEALHIGVTRFILKPSNMEELEEAVKAMTEKLRKKGICGDPKGDEAGPGSMAGNADGNRNGNETGNETGNENGNGTEGASKSARKSPDKSGDKIGAEYKQEAENENESGNKNESRNKNESGNKNEAETENSAGSFIVKNALAFIRANYNRKITLKEVADSTYVSQWHLSKLLNRHTGQSFSEILNTTRIDAAKELLENPALRIGEIAEEVGFLDLAHFSRVFKKVTGVSANEYRNQLR